MAVPKYIFEVTSNFKYNKRTDGSVKVCVAVIIAKTVIEACEKAEKLLADSGGKSEDVEYHDIVMVERKDLIDA